MKAEDLKNYGKGLVDSVPDAEAARRIRQASRRVRELLRAELGDGLFEEHATRVSQEIERVKPQALHALEARGLHNRPIAEGIVRRIAIMKALADLLGMDRASAVQRRLLDITLLDLMTPMWPTVEDYKRCDDPPRAFMDYTKGSMNANVRDGLHDIVWTDDSPTALAFDVRYCAWHEAAKALGDPYLCYPSTCYGDEITIPTVLDELGGVFTRKGTLAQGAPVCDFRYEFPQTDSR